MKKPKSRPRLILLIALFLSASAANAQDIHFSQFGNSPLNLSPGLAGVFGGDLRFVGNYRKQWQSVPVPYLTFSGSVENKVYWTKGKYDRFLTGSLILNYDRQSSIHLTSLQIGIPISVTMPLAKNKFLTIGVTPAFGQRAFDTNRLTFDAQWVDCVFDPSADAREDQLFQSTNLKYFDLSAGANLRLQSAAKRSRLDVGTGLHHINRPNHDFWSSDLTDPGNVKLYSKLTIYALGLLQMAPNFDLVGQGLYQRQGGYREVVYGGGLRMHLNKKAYRELALHLIARPLPGIRRVSGDEAEAWHDASAAALASRCREVLAIFETNLDEVYLADLGEGTTLSVLGLARPLRLALEANYGFVLFSNGIPIGYGGVTPLGPQANTGLNLFAPFRQSEAGMLFAQALRAFTTMFGVRRFVVNPYQFGMENEEALASGAFWFYDRLGFRARSDASRALAARERERRAADPSYRSDADTLRDLALGDVVLTLPGSEDAPFVEEQVLTRIGAHTARLLSGSIGAARARAIAALESATCDAYTGMSADRLAHDEQLGLRLLAPALAAVAPTVAEWPPTKRAALWEFVRLKGALQESPAARAAAEAWDFWRELERRLIGVA